MRGGGWSVIVSESQQRTWLRPWALAGCPRLSQRILQPYKKSWYGTYLLKSVLPWPFLPIFLPRLWNKWISVGLSVKLCNLWLKHAVWSIQTRDWVNTVLQVLLGRENWAPVDYKHCSVSSLLNILRLETSAQRMKQYFFFYGCYTQESLWERFCFWATAFLTAGLELVSLVTPNSAQFF